MTRASVAACMMAVRASPCIERPAWGMHLGCRVPAGHGWGPVRKCGMVGGIAVPFGGLVRKCCIVVCVGLQGGEPMS